MVVFIFLEPCDYRMILPTMALNLSDDRGDSCSGTSAAIWNISLSAYYILIFIIAVPGNSLALWAFFRQEKTSPSKVFLSSLSVADISYILILPMRIVYHLMDCHWPFGRILCLTSGFLFYLNMYCSLYLMSFISLDRFLAVVMPLKSQSVRKPRYAKVSVGVLWVTVIVSMTPTLFKSDPTATPGICDNLYLQKTSSTALISTIVAFAIPLTSVIVFYILILLKIRTLSHQQQYPVRAKAVKMIILILTNFLLAFVPYHVCRVIYIKMSTSGPVASEQLARANQITSALTCMSSVLDPVMYFFLNRAYRNQLHQLFCKTRGTDSM